MSEGRTVAKSKKKTKTQKPKTTHRKLRHQHQQKRKRKIQLTHEFEENENEVRTLLESISLLSESNNNSQRDEDNTSTCETFFYGTKYLQKHSDNGSEDIKSEESVSVDDLENTTRGTQPQLACTFIQIEPHDLQTLIAVEKAQYYAKQQEFVYKQKSILENSLTAFTMDKNTNMNMNTNTILMLNRYAMESKTRKEKINKQIYKTLGDMKNMSMFHEDNILYKSYCEFKFKPIFIEPSLNSLAIPSKKFLVFNIKDLHFTEHPLLQEEHRLANTLELLYEHSAQRLKEKITEKLYADLHIERNILNQLLRSAENGNRANADNNQEKIALKIEHHLYRVKALREKLFDEELTNKQLLQDILCNWVKLKDLRRRQEQHFTSLKLRIKVEDLDEAESKNRLRMWTQRFETDLNEIYREQLEEYYRCNRLKQQQEIGDVNISKRRKPRIKQLSTELKEKYAKCFLNPKEPRIEVIRTFANSDYKNLPGPRKIQSYFMRIYIDRQMVGETRVYRLERDLSLTINESLGIVFNRSLPKDIRIKLYKKSKISSAQKVANIIVPLPVTLSSAQNSHTTAITFSSHKQPISGYMRLNLHTDEELYSKDTINNLFPAPQQHTEIPKNVLREWHQRKLVNTNDMNVSSLFESNSNNSDTEEDMENVENLAKETCTFQEDLLQFCDPLQMENSQRLNLLRSRYLKTDDRTRNLRCIPMLDHEIEFDGDMDETVLETGNWMDPIDFHKHEGKKYLCSLYAAIQTQCGRLTKMIESRENLLLNDEPISWSAFFQTIKLIFQPRLILTGNKDLSPSSFSPSLSNDNKQNFKIICTVIRATGIPVRITNPEDTDSRDHTTPESSNVFLLQNIRYSNVRPFVAVSYKDKLCRTMTAEGSNPTWNEQLVLQLGGTLADLHDDLIISLYDEAVENRMNDDAAVKNVDIYQRIQNNWLGEYRIPINAMLMQRKMDSVFELTTPKIIIGYKRPSLDSITTNNETNISIEQFPEIREAVRVWCHISLETNFEVPLLNSKCLDCSELREVRQHLTDWSIQAIEIQPLRFMEPFVCTADGKRLCITRILQPLAPPIEASENLMDSACRFVSLIAKPKFYNPAMRLTGVWLNNKLLLDLTWASPKDLGVLLCNFLLHMGLQCSLVLGMAYPYGECAFVLYYSDEGEIIFIDPCSGKRYGLKDTFCPLHTVNAVVTPNNFYINIQIVTRVSMMNFNLNDSSCWISAFTKKNPAPLGGFHSLAYRYHSYYNISDLKSNIERKVMKKINSWRAMRKTIWNRAFQPQLLSILQNLEQSVTFGSGSSHEELKYNNLLAAEFPNYKIFGFALNFSYTNLNQISDCIKTTGIHLNSNNNVEYCVAVHIHPYPNNIFSVWLFLITVVPL